MKKIIILLSLLLCGFAFAATETLNWYVDGQVYATTTCQTGDDVILPTAPTKYGYTFQGWNSYTPIEYLESTGTQYIDTGYIPNNRTSVFYNVLFKTSDLTFIFGSRSSGSSLTSEDQFYSGSNSNAGFWWYSGTKQTIFEQPTRLNIYYQKTISNSEISAIPTQPLFLFGLNIIGNVYPSSVRIKQFKIYNNSILVRDFIPVLDHNGSPCMYDKVTGQFFYNSGTGDFIAGPVINQ